MSGPYILDTCTLSHYLGKKANERTPVLVRRVDELLDNEPPRLSIVSVYEIHRWLERLLLEGKGNNKARAFNLFLSRATIYEMNEPVWRVAAKLHAVAAVRGITFAEADLFILVTAVVHGLRLLTTDTGLVENACAVGLGQNVEHLPVA